MHNSLIRIGLLFLILFLSGFLAPEDCGVYRWDYKTLVDSTGWRLLNKKTKYQTIYSLNQIKPPDKLGAQRTPYEKWKVTVTAWIVMLGEEDDHDYHLVLTNNTRKDSLIAEIPAPTCNKIDKFPALVKRYTTAREFIKENVGQPGSQIQEIDPVKIQITGFLFFDKVAHGAGHSKHGIEIHPVISIKLAN